MAMQGRLREETTGRRRERRCPERVEADALRDGRVRAYPSMSLMKPDTSLYQRCLVPVCLMLSHSMRERKVHTAASVGFRVAEMMMLCLSHKL